MIRQTKSVEIDGNMYTVKELTVGEIIDLLSVFEKGSDAFDNNVPLLFLEMFRPFGLHGIASMSGLTMDALKVMPVSLLRQLNEAGKSINTDFFDAVNKMTGVAVS
jgi:hypothetical protein